MTQVLPLPSREGAVPGRRAAVGLAKELPCECGSPSCRATIPLAAEAHRGSALRIIVAPDHYIEGLAVRVADRFFVVELHGRDALWPPRPGRAVHLAPAVAH
jgi:hypothetical protein